MPLVIPNASTAFDSPPAAEVKVINSAATAGKFSVTVPNGSTTPYTVGANDSKNIAIPLGRSTFTNTGTVNLEMDQFA